VSSPSRRTRAPTELHLPDHPGRQLVGLHDPAVPAAELAAALLLAAGQLAAGRPGAEHGRQAEVLGRRQDRHHHAEQPLLLVGRETGDRKDIVFFLDLLRAAIKESPANFGNYTPGQLPDNLTSAVATDDRTVTLTSTRRTTRPGST